MSPTLQAVHKLRIAEASPPEPDVHALRYSRLGQVILPLDLSDVYELGDRIRFSSFPGQMIPFKKAAAWLERAAFEASVYESWPFFVSLDHQSDPLAVIIHGPGKGMVMQQMHDGSDRMVAPSVQAFFEELASRPPTADFFGDEEEAWILPKELTGDDRRLINDLLGAVSAAQDPYEGESLASLAMSMMLDDDFVETFQGDLFPIINFRAILWGRFRKIGSQRAKEMEAKYAADFEERSRRW